MNQGQRKRKLSTGCYDVEQRSDFKVHNQTVFGRVLQGNVITAGRSVNFNLGESSHQKTLLWLSPIPYEQHHNTNKRDVLEGTGSWIWREKAMIEWRTSGEASVLWLRGIPGSGKTKLVSIVIEELLANSQDDHCLVYFYCSRNTAEPERSDPEEILRSIVRQMSVPSSRESVLRPVIEKYEEREKKGFADGPLRLEESVETIVKLTAHYSVTTIVIDALDECHTETRYRLLRALSSIIRDGTGLVKIFVSSRDDKDITLYLGDSPNLYIKASNNAADINRWVKAELSQAIADKRLLGGEISLELKREIAKTLTKQAQGMFRWVSLQLQNLCSNRINFESDLREELGRLPRDLAGIYSKIYEQITELAKPGRQIAERSLKWILCSQRKLSVNEFLAAVAISSEGITTTVREEDILHICRNLVILDTELGIFRFAHLSVREFLEERVEYKLSTTHTLAAEACLATCLGKSTNTTVASFQTYASVYWAHHCQMSGDNRGDPKGRLWKLLHEFFQQQANGSSPFIEWSRLAVVDDWSLDSEMSDKIHVTINSPFPIFAGCVWGFPEIFRDLARLTRGWTPLPRDLDTLESYGWTCLHAASMYGHCDIVRLLLEMGADTEVNGRFGQTALYLAAEGGRRSVVKLLVEKGADVEAKDEHGDSALHMAARGGHEAVVKLLVEKGADVEAKDKYGETALLVAVERDHEAVVKLLVEKGADVEARDEYGDTALEIAAQRGHEAVARLLVEKGADVEVKDKYGDSALLVAVERGHEAVVKLLLEKGADVELKYKYGDTALLVAVKRGHEAAVKLLVENGADVEAEDEYGVTALLVAVKWGQEAVVKLLVEKGADVEAKDKHGDTALLVAVERGHEAIVKLLVEKGADVEAKEKYEDTDTALLVAIKMGHEAIVKLLVEGGADVEARGEYGDTALDIAAQGDHEAVVKLLVEKGADVGAVGWSMGYSLQ